MSERKQEEYTGDDRKMAVKESQGAKAGAVRIAKVIYGTKSFKECMERAIRLGVCGIPKKGEKP